jgi:3-oxoacyl-[acyl-carrier protein] reductase
MDLGLRGKVAVVAAASQGLGFAAAKELAQEGAEVALCARNPVRLRQAATKIQSQTGREVFTHSLDVTDYAAVQKFVADTVRRFGRLDICVTNAGGPPAKQFSEISIEEWRAAVDLTLMSTVYFAREVLPLMKRNKWGRLLTITSVAVKQPIDGLLLSNSIRAAVSGLAKTLANEYGADGITVNNVCPGYTLTERLDELATNMAKNSRSTRESVLQNWAAQIPIGRVARPDEFGALIAFLASERASSINGATIPVDGGWLKGW